MSSWERIVSQPRLFESRQTELIEDLGAALLNSVARTNLVIVAARQLAG